MMSYFAPSEASESLVVAARVAVDLFIAFRWTKPGHKVPFEATVTEDGKPVAGVEVAFAYQGLGPNVTDAIIIGKATTDSNGKATFTWTATRTINTETVVGKDNPFKAWVYRYDTYWGSNTVYLAIAYPTTLTLSVSPSTVRPNEIFRVGGLLKYNETLLAGKTIKIYLDTTLLGEATTRSDGTYEASFTAPSTPGTYTVKARFEGELPTASPAEAGKPVYVGVTPIPLSGIIATIVGVGGIVTSKILR